MRVENEKIMAILDADHAAIVRGWTSEYQSFSLNAAPATDLQADQLEIVRGLRAALAHDGEAEGFNDESLWAPLRDTLSRLSRSRAAQGQSAADTSAFVLSIKKPVFDAAQAAGTDAATLVPTLWTLTSITDRMAQWTMSTFQSTREEVIARQQHELLELSTPVVKLWDGVLAVPLIGTLDSSRAQTVMENLLERIVETGSQLAIIDITGVPTVDTLVAQHLLKTITAIRLMGADCIISGIRPQIAQTIVHLGIDLQGIETKASLADALALAMRMTGHTVARHAA
jgi:rsbT co-antagonist protein RsbR